MVEITVEKFIEMVKRNNPDKYTDELGHELHNALERKRDGRRCLVCGNTIWAAGSAIAGWDGCFACITGESDDCEDYEII